MEQNFVKKQRDSNLELLRCILMILIVFYHLLLHGTNGTFVQFFEWQPLQITLSESYALMFCMFPVDCFCIISGFYKINIVINNKINWQKLIKTYTPILFYSVVIAGIMFLTGKIELKNFLLCCVPILQCNWWFASCYMLLCILSPLLNNMFDNFYKSKTFVLLFVLTGLLNYVTTGSHFQNTVGIGSNRLFMIVYCYLVGRFINAYEGNISFVKNNCFVLFIASFICEFVLVFVANQLYPAYSDKFWYYLSLNSSPFTICQGILFFLLFKRRKYFCNRFINILGGCSFAVYLIHENLHVRKWLYGIVDGRLYKDNFGLFLYLMGAAMIVFIFCELIEIVRKFIFSKTFIKA